MEMSCPYRQRQSGADRQAPARHLVQPRDLAPALSIGIDHPGIRF